MFFKKTVKITSEAEFLELLVFPFNFISHSLPPKKLTLENLPKTSPGDNFMVKYGRKTWNVEVSNTAIQKKCLTKFEHDDRK